MRSFFDFDYVDLAIVPLFLFSGTFFPLSEYPTGLAWVVRCSPLYQGVAIERALVLGEPSWTLLLRGVPGRHGLRGCGWPAAGWDACSSPDTLGRWPKTAATATSPRAGLTLPAVALEEQFARLGPGEPAPQRHGLGGRAGGRPQRPRRPRGPAGPGGAGRGPGAGRLPAPSGATAPSPGTVSPPSSTMPRSRPPPAARPGRRAAPASPGWTTSAGRASASGTGPGAPATTPDAAPRSSGGRRSRRL